MIILRWSIFYLNLNERWWLFVKTTDEQNQTEKIRDRYTISFRPKKVNKPINEMINKWTNSGDSPTDKIVEILIEARKLDNSSQARKFKNIFSSVHNALAPVYGEGEELYLALDEVLGEILNVNSGDLFDLIQHKIDEKTMPHRFKSIESTSSSTMTTIREETSPIQKVTQPVQEPKIEFETVTPKSQKLETILVNGEKTKVEHVSEPAKPTPSSQSISTQESEEVDFFGSAGNDFFTTNSL